MNNIELSQLASKLKELDMGGMYPRWPLRELADAMIELAQIKSKLSRTEVSSLRESRIGRKTIPSGKIRIPAGYWKNNEDLFIDG